MRRYAIALLLAAISTTLLFAGCAASKAESGAGAAEAPAAGGGEAEAKAANPEFEQAKEYLRFDNYLKYGDGETALKTMLTKEPDSVEVKAWLAQLYLAWGDQLLTIARQHEKKKTTLDAYSAKLKAKLDTEKDEKKLATMKSVFDKMAEDGAQASKEYDVAKKESDARLAQGYAICEEIIKTAPDNYLGYRVLADFHRIKGDKQQAEAFVAKIAAMNPDSAGLAFTRGAIAWQIDNKAQDAIKFFDEALLKDEKFSKARYFKGLAMDAGGERAEAVAVMRNVLNYSPDHPGAANFVAAWGYLNKTSEKVNELIGEK